MNAYQKEACGFRFNCEEYKSVMELTNTLKNRPVMPAWKYEDLAKSVERNPDWYGVESYEKAFELLANGWSDRLKDVKKFTGNVCATASEKRIAFKNNVVGFAPVVPLAIMNVPNAMIDMTMKPIKSKVVKIMYNLDFIGSTSSKTIMNNGLKIIASIISLEKSGYRCELNACQNYWDGNRYSDLIMIKIKDANQPLDLKRVMFPMIHPAMFRVIGFDWQNKLPTGKYMLGRGQVICKTLGKSKTAEVFKKAFGENTIYLDGNFVSGNDTTYVENIIKGETKE